MKNMNENYELSNNFNLETNFQWKTLLLNDFNLKISI